MIFANYGPVADIEIVWTVVAFVGLIYSALNVRDAQVDLKILEHAGIKNGRLSLARYQIEAELLRAIMQLIFLAIGVSAMALPEAPDSLDLPTTQVVIRVLITYGLIISSVLLSIKSYLGYRVRRILTQPEHDTFPSDIANEEANGLPEGES